MDCQAVDMSCVLLWYNPLFSLDSHIGEETFTVEDPSGSSEDVEYDDEADDSVLTDSF